jgi:hypothetical protein
MPACHTQVQKLILICAGTGIGLTMQLIERIISNKMDKTKLKLLYANKTEAVRAVPRLGHYNIYLYTHPSL